MSAGLRSLPADRLAIVYDGECPFCSRYVRFTRLRDSVGPVDLIDARRRPDVVAEMKSNSLDINQGMLVQFQGRLYWGGDALHILALLSSSSGAWNRMMAALMSRSWLARGTYPWLRMGRNAVLRLLGRRQIA